MKHTIEIFPKWNKWAFIISGSVNIMIGVRQIYLANSWTDWTEILGIVLAIGGLLMVIYGIIIFTPSSRLVPKIEIGDEQIIIKQEFSKNGVVLNWGNIKEIVYKTFEIDFVLNDDKTEIVNLQTSAEISVEIKETIRQLADQKQITVTGG